MRWAWSPCSPGKEGWNAAVGGGQGTVPGKQEVSSTAWLCILITPQRWSALWTIRCKVCVGVGWGGDWNSSGREGRGQI